MVPTQPRTHHVEVGRIGEEIAAKWLISENFMILEQNYWQKWGEIDIVAMKGNCVHFVEVKTVSFGTKAELRQSVSHETFRPEENVHGRKQDRLARAIETWIAQNRYTDDFQVDVVTVRVVLREKFAALDCLENIVFS